MSAIFKAIHEFDKRIEARAEHFAFKHPYLSFFCGIYRYADLCSRCRVFLHRNYYDSYCFDFRVAVSALI